MPVKKPVIAAVVISSATVWLAYASPSTSPSTEPMASMRPRTARITRGFRTTMISAARVKRIAKKSKKGCWAIAGFMTTNEAPHIAVTAMSDQMARR